MVQPDQTHAVYVVILKLFLTSADVNTGLMKILVPVMLLFVLATMLEVLVAFIIGLAVIIVMIQPTIAMRSPGKEVAVNLIALLVDRKSQMLVELRSTTSIVEVVLNKENAVTVAIQIMFVGCAGDGWTVSRAAVLQKLSSLRKRGKLVH